jgi:hypothetical protein
MFVKKSGLDSCYHLLFIEQLCSKCVAMFVEKTVQDSCYHFLFLEQLCSKCSHKSDAGKILGTLMASLKYIELVHSLWRKSFSDGVFRADVKDNFVQICTRATFNVSTPHC